MLGHAISDDVFLENHDYTQRYKCSCCKCLLRDAVQPSCGHWMCEPCAEKLFAFSSAPECPTCRETLTSDDGAAYFPDRFVRREVSNIKVKCVNHQTGCSWQGKLGYYQEHVKSCSYAKTSCPLYGLGCRYDHKMTHDELLDHLTAGEASLYHFQYLAKLLKPIIEEKKHKPTTTQLSDSGFAESSSCHDVYENSYSQHKARPVTELIRRGCNTDSLVERDGAGQHMTSLHPHSTYTYDDFEPQKLALELKKVRDEIERKLKQDVSKKDAEISRLKMQISALEKKVQAKETETEDRSFQLSLLENVSYDGVMIWKIPQFAQRMADAQSGKYTSIFSLPFYTSRYGYKLCLRLYILGDGIGKGTHMSLFLVVMRGEFDNIIQWPFTSKVTFRLLNQNGGKDIVDSFLPDPMSSSFKKPKTDMNVASGCPRFVTHNDLRTGGFIVDDTVFIKVKVDTSSMKS